MAFLLMLFMLVCNLNTFIRIGDYSVRYLPDYCIEGSVLRRSLEDISQAS